MEISNLNFSPNKTYLLASDNRGYIYIWRCKQLIVKASHFYLFQLSTLF